MIISRLFKVIHVSSQTDNYTMKISRRLSERIRRAGILLLLLIWYSSPFPAIAGDRNWHSVTSWVYQLCNYKNHSLNAIAETDFDLAVIDLSRDGNNDYFTRKEIEAVKKTGKIVLAYFEIGAIESYRPEWHTIDTDLKAGEVNGWPEEQYVKFWDERWWPIVKNRVNRALDAGFDGAYLDLITAYEEIRGTGTGIEERAHKMIELIARISKYAKSRAPDFKIVPQNCPELYTQWTTRPNHTYINAIDGLGLESVYFLAHDKPANEEWCQINRDNAVAIMKAGKIILGVDYAKKKKNISASYKKQKELGFIPYVSVDSLDMISKGQ